MNAIKLLTLDQAMRKISITKEEGMFIAKCIDVGTVSQGKTQREALANLKEATGLYLETMRKKSFFELVKPFRAIAKKNGWKQSDVLKIIHKRRLEDRNKS